MDGSFLKNQDQFGKKINRTIREHSNPILIYQIETRNIRYANRSAVSMFGYSQDEFGQISISALFCEEFDTLKFKRVFTSQNGYYRTNPIACKDIEKNIREAIVVILPIGNRRMIVKLLKV